MQGAAQSWEGQGMLRIMKEECTHSKATWLGIAHASWCATLPLAPRCLI